MASSTICLFLTLLLLYSTFLCIGVHSQPDKAIRIKLGPQTGVSNSHSHSNADPLEEEEQAEENKYLACANVHIEDLIDCFPEGNATRSGCSARGCCWLAPNRPKDANEHQQSQSHEVAEYVNKPPCFYPPNFPSYSISNIVRTDFGFSFDAVRQVKSFRSKDIMRLKGMVYVYEQNLIRLKIIDSNNERYEVPINIKVPNINKDLSDFELMVADSTSLTIKNVKKNFRVKLLTLGPLFFADQYIELTTELRGFHVYGIGERRGPLLLDASSGWTRIALWAYDTYAIETKANLYGVHPFLVALDTSGVSSGIFFLNSNAMEFELQPHPALTIRTIGGVIDLFHILGDVTSSSPASIVSQYWNMVHGGEGIAMPPYWSLGYHLCRWGYWTDEGLESVINRTLAAHFPYEAQWVDIDHMERYLDWTFDQVKFKSLPALVQRLHANNLKFIPIADVGISDKEPSGSYISFDLGNMMNIFMKRNGKLASGKVWPGTTVFPDWTNPNASDWWLTISKQYFQIFHFDGLWIDMNEPSNFVDGTTTGCATSAEPEDYLLDEPPYVPRVDGGKIYWHTMCPSAKQYLSSHYNLHSLSGYFEILATNKVLKEFHPGKRPFMLSRSTFAGAGRYAFHWTGDVHSTWKELAVSIPAILSFGLFGIPMVGADVCGFEGNTNEELCIRWHQLGAFYPFMRNHNDHKAIEQDPGVWSPSALNAMRDITALRYSLLPYLYTLFYRAHEYNELPARPLSFIAPFDPTTHAIQSQFLWGDALLISPVLFENATTVFAYFPLNSLENGFSSVEERNLVATIWYDFRTGARLEEKEQHEREEWFSGQEITPEKILAKLHNRGVRRGPGMWKVINAPLNTIPLHVRGGYILPLQTPATNTILSRQNNFHLLVALNHITASSGEWDGTARGSLYLDDSLSEDTIDKGEYSYIEFNASKNGIESHVRVSGYNPESDGKERGESGTLESITIYGVQAELSRATVGTGSNEKALEVSYDRTIKVAQIKNINWKLVTDFAIRIEYKD